MNVPDDVPCDALAIPFEDQIDAFVNSFPEHRAALKELATDGEKLEKLSILLKNPQYALHVARLFSPLLVDLCARWLDDDEQDESKFAVFGLLLPAHEQLYPVLSQFLRRPSLVNGPLGFVTAENVAQIPLKTLQTLLLAYHRLIEACCHLHEEFKWPNTPLQCLFEPPHPDAGVLLLAIRCFAFHVGMNEPARVELEEKLVGSPEKIDPFVDTGFGNTVDVWVLPILDSQRIQEERSLCDETLRLCHGSPRLNASMLSPRVAYIGGTLLLKDSTNTVVTNYVQTKSNSVALQQVATLLTRRMPILLSGPSSSGKTTMIEYLSASLHTTTSNVVTIHLSDTSLDPRSLLGSYVSSTQDPGTFEWKDGVLVQALEEGKVLVLENIDKASSEVLGTLWPLVESLSMLKPIGSHARLDVLGRKTVIAKEGFALFATRTVPASESGSLPPPTFLGSHKWSRADLSSCSDNEMVLIISNKYPTLGAPLIKSLTLVWNGLNSLEKSHPTTIARPIHMGDLIKWASRIQILLRNSPGAVVDAMEEDEQADAPISSFILNPKIREEVFLAARDIFFGSVNPFNESSKTRIEAGLRLLADALSISADRTSWLLEKRTAEMELRKDQDGRITQVSLDRIVLNAARTSSPIFDQVSTNSRFALHRPSLNLLSSLAGCIQANEAMLLTGETGTGKTTVVTYLASLLSQPLVSLNLSHQTESSDLLGGYKPLDARVPAQNIQQQFTQLFSKTFSREKNVKFEEAIRIAVSGGKWKRAIALWKEAAGRAEERIQEKNKADKEKSQDGPRKRRKLDDFAGSPASSEQWATFRQDVADFEANHVLSSSKAVFHFVEGPLVTALRLGQWVLLDEINLASAETLEAVGSILHDSTGSITLTERGDLEPVVRHPNFRLFTCMNPATDVGKKDLPPHIRAQLTEIYVSPPDANRDALLAIVSQYIGQIAMADRAAILDVADFYVAARKLSEGGHIADGANHKPHYSMRTLTRALTFAVDAEPTFGLRRAIWEGVLMAFSTILEQDSATTLKNLAAKHLLSSVKNVNSLLAQIPAPPDDKDRYMSVGPFWLERGLIEPQPVSHYVLTPSVQAKVLDLARILTTRRFPVLIQGPTSSGKTSVIEYLAKRTGHRFVRINNHEHTDIQEYVGSYVTNPKTGLLVFQDGLLVQALRRGDWVVLDELNLAPSDVLEALNRLLDDNRELVVPETGEIVKPHPHFMLFATQNPPGLYAGRKVLSRAFRNRFLELHFQDVPQQELEQIIKERCEIAPSYAQRIVAVFRELQTRRQSGRVFETKHGFATLRDLFRWAGRSAGSYQELAEDGYMLIAERTRKEEDKMVVKEVLESIMRVRIDEAAMYDIRSPRVAESLHCRIPDDSSVVWTFAMRRLFVLLARALCHKEPTLLVGETGSGKTSVCELYANAMSLELRAVNCHQNTETADLLGGQRPLRHRASWLEERLQRVKALLTEMSIPLDDEDTEDSLLARVNTALIPVTNSKEKATLQEATRLLKQPVPLFEWQDGPLVLAMRSASLFLLDEISLADDSVLERINSVLELSRTLILAEKSTWDPQNQEITANPEFQIAATMNPGGDHGKKELSPALRNRFTEIWVPMISSREDRLLIVRASWKHAAFQPFTEAVVDFLHWVTQALKDDGAYGLRDLLAWVQFSDEMAEKPGLTPEEIFHHSAHMVVLDGLGSLPRTQGWSKEQLSELKGRALAMLSSLFPISSPVFSHQVILEPDTVAIGPFQIQCGPLPPNSLAFAFQAPTTLENARRILRACQLNKSILLEGSPGVGKTSLVSALASLARQTLCRVNLSDQTDLIDLFGSDLPLEGGAPGEFVWKDAEFLQALQHGHWVLLDEMNLAPQSVLEGLNAILDHRGTVFLPELGRSFTKHPNFRLFAAQNPAQQGGGRKGLPKSFLNRFTKVYMEELNADDLLIISKNLHPTQSEDELRQMIAFNSSVHYEATVRRSIGRQGSPWEFNLRDIMRWLNLLESANPLERDPGNPVEYMDEVYSQRFRTSGDRLSLRLIEERVFPSLHEPVSGVHASFSARYAQFGHSLIQRKSAWRQPTYIAPLSSTHFKVFQTMEQCVQQSWLTILVGSANSGKTTVLHQFAALNGETPISFFATSGTDASDLLGSFEQAQSPPFANQPVSDDKSGRRSLDGMRSIPYNADDKVAGFTPLTVPTGDIHTTMKDNEIASGNSARSKGRFVWVDGPLVKALKNGTWFILDNANLCNPSVLDRLNSLCEPNGALTLTERGLLDGKPLILRPHPNFRLFMAMDPVNGELSRAMRNRGIEINMAMTDVLAGQAVNPQTIYNKPYYGGALNAFGHLHLRLVRHMSFLLSSCQDLPLDIRLEFVLSQMSQLDALLFLRLKDSQLQPVVSTILESRTDFFDMPRILAKELTLPLEFLATEGTEPLLNANVYARIQNRGALDSLAWNALKRTVTLRLWKTDHESEQEYGYLEGNSIFEISKSLVEGQAFGREVTPEVKAIYPLLYITRRFLESIVATVSPVHDIAACVALAELWVTAREMTEKSTLDYTLWRSLLQDFDRLLPKLILPDLRDAIAAALHSMRLTSGFAMDNIWAHQKPYFDGQRRIDAMLEELQKDLFTERPEHRRTKLLDLAALISIESPQKPVPHEPIAESPVSVETDDQELVKQLILLQLPILQLAIKQGEISIPILARYCEIALDTVGFPKRSVVSTKAIEWIIRTQSMVGGQVANAFHIWSTALWHIDPENGARCLTIPSTLLSTLRLCSRTAHTIAGSKAYKITLHGSLNAAMLECDLPFISRVETLSTLFINDLMIASSAVSESNQDPFTITDETGYNVLPIFTLSEGLDEAPLVAILTKLLESCHTKLSISLPSPTRIEALASGWVYLGLLMIHLYVPNYPLDPEGANFSRHKQLLTTRDHFIAKIELYRNAEMLSTGQSTNLKIQELEGQLRHTRSLIQNLPPTRGVARKTVDLQSLFSELARFHDQLLDVNRIRELLRACVDNDPTAASREQVNQDSWSQFLERIRTRYALMGDLWYPVDAWMGRVRVGMSLLRHVAAARSQEVESASTSFLRALTSFPSVVGYDMIRSTKLAPPPHLDPHEWSAARILASISHIRTGDPFERHCESLWLSFEQLFGLWIKDKMKKEAEERENASLYKRKKDIVTMQAEEDEEAEEFRRLFPEYEDVLDENSTQIKTNAPFRPHISPYQLFLALPFLATSPIVTARHSPAAALNLASWTSQVEHDLHPDLDGSSLIFRVQYLNKELQRLNQTPSSTNGYDFYHDSNVQEVHRALDIVTALNERLSTLAEAWPDQMVLRHLSERCDAIANLDVYSSLAKVLSALEQLLLQTDDWQKYANKENGILDFQQSLGNLIIDWRKIELSCWFHLLDSQAVVFSNGVADWWFRLYESIVETSKSVGDEAESDFLRDILPLLENFLISSPLGQFSARLHLLEMFKTFIVRVYPEGSSLAFLQRMAKLLGALVDFYQQFRVKVQTALATRREAIDKEVKSFIKLASWKDINVLALKASAQRTHHQLHRSIRKFRGVLQGPVAELLTALPEQPAQKRGTGVSNISSTPFINVVPSLNRSQTVEAHLLKLQDTLQVFHSVSCTVEVPFLEASTGRTDELSDTILSRINDLQNSIPPSHASSKKGWEKNLLTRKKKALADLFKACKEVGLPHQLGIKERASQNDRLWIMERRVPIPQTSEMTTKMDWYFDKVRLLLPTLQSSLGSHSSDVSTRDITKLLNYAHVLMHFALEARSGVHILSEFCYEIECFIDSLSDARDDNGLTLVGPSARLYVIDHLSLLSYTISATEEAVEAAVEFSRSGRTVHVLEEEFITQIQRQLIKIKEYKEALSIVYKRISRSQLPILLSDEYKSAKEATHLVEGLCQIMCEWQSREVRARHLTGALVQALTRKLSELIREPIDQSGVEKDIPERPIGIMLVIMQRLHSLEPPLAAPSFLINGHSRRRQLWAILDVAHLWQELRSFIADLHNASEATALARRLLPFLQRFHHLVNKFLKSLTLWTKSLFKLASILATLGLNLAENGFCKAKDSEEEAAEQGTEMKADGTGVGEGQGENDVSNEIEDPSQVEGLQGQDEKPEQEVDRKEDKKNEGGLEMEDDFEGELESVQQSEDNDSDEEDEGDEEMDEKIQDLDPADPDAVDEKMWESKNTNDQDDGTQDDKESKENKGDSQMAAKEDTLHQQRKEDRETDAQREKETSPPPEESEEQGDDDGGPDTENLPNEAGAQMNSQIQEEEILDLPEEMALELEGDTNLSEAEGEGGDSDEESAPSVDPGKEDHNMEEENRSESGSIDGQREATPDNAESGKDDQSLPPDIVAKPDQTPGGEQNDSTAETTASTTMGEGKGDGDEQRMETEENISRPDGQAQNINAQESLSGLPEGNPSIQPPTNDLTGQKDELQASESVRPNQRKSLADALSEVQRHYEQILQQSEDAPPQMDGANPEDARMEHAEEEDESAKLALAPAGEEEVTKLKDLKILEDTPLDHLQAQDVPMLDETVPEPAPLASRNNEMKQESLDEAGRVEGALMGESIRQSSGMDLQGDLDTFTGIPAPTSTVHTSEEVEAQLVSWQANRERHDGIGSLWGLYSSLTHELAWTLCEQLRLILEPTKSTRLRGDYRTGKRLNMKKIIPYIASEYTKDKIWLRRTRPSQREYQILLALDDSRSMSESHAEHLAFQTLALVSKALTRLEAGDISVVKFGETVEVLHGFSDGPFNDAAGAHVIENFSFNQTSTDVLSLVETSLKVLQTARETRGPASLNTNLWQLEIIISDGICSHHEKLRATLRRASEQKVMIVFVIVDALSRSNIPGQADGSPIQNSILSMKQVRADLSVERYLDTFPFEYYVVVRNVEGLPEVLSSTLKQFFERIAEE